MPTVIDSLIVQLGLDAKDVDAKAPGVRQKLKDLEKSGDSASKGIGGVSKAAKGTGEELTSLAGKMAAFLALIGGTVALRQFTMEAIKTNTQLNYLSKNLNIPVQTLSQWGIAATMVGGSAQEMQGYISYLTNECANLANGLGSSLIPVIGQMGIALRDSSGKIRPATELLKDMAKWAQKMGPGNRVGELSWFRHANMPENVANFLLQDPGRFLAMLDKASKFTVTDKESASAGEMTEQLAILHAQFNKLGYDLLEKVTPILEKVFDLLTRGLNWCIAHQTAVLSFFAGVTAATVALSLACFGLALSMIGVTWPILLVVAAIAALAAAFVGLTSDYSKWSQGGDSFFDWTQFEVNIRKAADAFKWLGDKIEEATDRFENWLRKMGIKVPDGAVKKGLTWWWNNATPEGLLGWKINETGGANSEGNLSAEQIKKYFLDKGYSKDWAAAMAASAWGESKYDPKAVGDNGTSFGLFQLHDEARKDAFRKRYGHGIENSNYLEQLDFAATEMKGLGIDTSSSPGARYAASIVTQRFERPKDMAGDSAKRGVYAEQLINGIPDASSVPSSVSSSTNTSHSSNDNSRATHIGHIDIHTLATDAQSIWKDMSRNMDWLTVSPANSGSL
jgi:hypothetical protein